MFRANIYSVEPLEQPVREALHDGIDMLASYMCERVVQDDKLVRLPMNPDGTLNPERVGTGKLDKMVEMHLFAVPLKPQGGRVGEAHSSRGVAFVDTARESLDGIRRTALHEGAHGFGFVLDGAPQSIGKLSGHCRDASCVMHPSTEAIYEDYDPVDLVTLFNSKNFLTSFAQGAAARRPRLVFPEARFCIPCRGDLKSKGGEQIAKLRDNRLFHWNGV